MEKLNTKVKKLEAGEANSEPGDNVEKSDKI
jgi:hypothetical protein